MAILQQPGSHATVGKAAAQSAGLPAHCDHNPVTVDLDLNLVAGVQPGAITNRLWDHDLSLGPDP